MIVRCKLDSDLIGLTIDKSYTVTEIDNIGFRIIDDEMRNFWYKRREY